MSNDTIPSQLPPATIPASLGELGNARSDREGASAGPSPAVKWLLVAAVAVAVYVLAR